MHQQLSGMSALVTGGARGIGRGIGSVLAERGASVCVSDLATWRWTIRSCIPSRRAVMDACQQRLMSRLSWQSTRLFQRNAKARSQMKKIEISMVSKVSAMFVTSLIFVLSGCFQVTDREPPYVDPCIPLNGSEVDPCERQPHWSVNAGASASYTLESLPKMPFSLLEEIRRMSNLDGSHGLYSPQFYVRGTFIPNSSRCVRARAMLLVLDDGSLISFDHTTDSGGKVIHNCFIDLQVHEYLNGYGPDRVPIEIWYDNASPETLTGDYAARLAQSYPMKWLEGREMVIALSRPNDMAYGAWGLPGLPTNWDVQRGEDGEVVVVGGWAHIDHRFDYEFTLNEFRMGIKMAMAAIKEENGGRVGDSLNDRMFAESANLGSLLENLRLYGAYSVADITPVSAPRVPGDTDPDPYGLLVSDAAVTAVAEVPGGLEGTATPVSALGDEPTATATVEPTVTEEAEPTATSTVEPTATPEAAPTPEPEATPTPDAEVAPTATPEAAPTPEPGLTDTPTPEPEPTATDTPEPVIEPTATATPEPAIEPTATPEDAVATDTPEPEVPAPEGPGAVGGEGPGEGGPDGSDTGTGPDG